MKRFKTAESVCAAHPDKVCDFISDCILDACLEQDENSRVACEVMASRGEIHIAGEITTKAHINPKCIAGEALMVLGYDPGDFKIYVNVHKQSVDIKAGVDHAIEYRNDPLQPQEIGAGDQGTVYGYATDETESNLPLQLEMAHTICKTLDGFMDRLPLGPDGKCQVTVECGEDGRPERVSTIVVSVQHEDDVPVGIVKKLVTEMVLPKALSEYTDYIDEETEILVNPSGRFVEGGPAADTGLTGRKIIVDTYGGEAAHGGGAFSGKDPTKVDRSGAYMARAIANNVVDAGLAHRCQVAISYAIGKSEPVMVEVETFGTNLYPEEMIRDMIRDIFDMTPQGIIMELGLCAPIYSLTSAYGHFSNKDFPWESFNKIRAIRKWVERFGEDYN